MVKKLFALGFVALLAIAAIGTVHADITLSDLNSELNFSDTGNVKGMFEWQVDGVNQLYQQWWWYRVDGTGPERGIDTLRLLKESVTDNYLERTYSGAGFELTVKWSLTGGEDGSGWSDVAETARIVNKGDCPLNFSLFEYSDFDLNGSVKDDDLLDTDVACYTDTPKGVFVTQTDWPLKVTESAITRPDHWEIGPFSTLVDKLNDGYTTNLADGVTPYQGDVTWALQWDFVLPVGGTVIVSKDKLFETAIPEWNSLFLAAIGMAGTIGIRMRRR